MRFPSLPKVTKIVHPFHAQTRDFPSFFSDFSKIPERTYPFAKRRVQRHH
jgi:hypothetical protein